MLHCCQLTIRSFLGGVRCVMLLCATASILLLMHAAFYFNIMVVSFNIACVDT